MKTVVFFLMAALAAAKGGSTYHAPKAPKIHAPRVRAAKPPKVPKVHTTKLSTAKSISSIKRDPKQRSAFLKTNPCPSTGKKSGACPGYVVDHKLPLACGGADAPANMQWQTEDAAKVKDSYERNGCR